jgi:hypothetical protein
MALLRGLLLSEAHPRHGRRSSLQPQPCEPLLATGEIEKHSGLTDGGELASEIVELAATNNFHRGKREALSSQRRQVFSASRKQE